MMDMMFAFVFSGVACANYSALGAWHIGLASAMSSTNWLDAGVPRSHRARGLGQPLHDHIDHSNN
jgi:hypothetical protein